MQSYSTKNYRETKNRVTDRYRERQTEKERLWHIEVPTTKAVLLGDNQTTGRQTDKQTDRQTGRQRQTDRQKNSK